MRRLDLLARSGISLGKSGLLDRESKSAVAIGTARKRGKHVETEM